MGRGEGIVAGQKFAQAGGKAVVGGGEISVVGQQLIQAARQVVVVR